MNKWHYGDNSPEALQIRKAGEELVQAYADKQFKQEGITDEQKKDDIRKDIRRELLYCNGKILNLPYSHLEEQSAVLTMLSEHTFMQIMKFRSDAMDIREINWLVNELQDCVQKLNETVDRIIKYEDDHSADTSKMVKGETNE